jgi:DNA polymerase III sliding clamp (beta) subunit (PCNA family)
VVPQKRSAPILGTAVLSASNGVVSVRTSDLAREVRNTIPATVTSAGAVAIPIDELAALMSLVEGTGQVELVTEGRTVALTTPEYVSTLITEDATALPLLRTSDHELLCSVAAAELWLALNRVSFAVRKDPERPIIGGVLFRLEAETITLVGADPYRAAETRLQARTNQVVDLVVPIGVIDLLRPILSSSDRIHLELSANGHVMSFASENDYVCGKLLEGPYPQYESVFDDSKPWKHITADTSALLRLVRAAAVIARPPEFAVNLSVATDRLHLSSEATELGQFATDIPITVAGVPAPVRCNGQLLADGVAPITSDNTMLSFDPLGRIVARPTNGDPYRYVLMPISGTAATPAA